MRKILLLVLISLPAYSLIKYGDKIWWEKPVFQVQPQKAGPFMIFKTPLKPEEVRFVAGKILIYDRKADRIILYSPSFKEITAVNGIMEIGKKLFGQCQSYVGCESELMIPSPDGRKVVVGYPNPGKRLYPIAIIDLFSGKAKKLAVLDIKHYPAVAHPIEKLRRDPSALKDFYSTFIENGHFARSYWVGNKIYLWYPPDYSLYFGGLLIIDLKTGKLTEPFKWFDRLLGVCHGALVYTLNEDEDASGPPDKIFVRSKVGDFSIADADPHHAACGGKYLLYRKNDHTTWVLYDLEERKEVSKFRADRSLKLLALAPSGKRAFFVGKVGKKASLYLYDFRDGKYHDLFPMKDDENFSQLETCYDGEFFMFINRGNLWAGYLTDLTPPFLSVKISPLHKGKAFLSPVLIEAEAHDRCFTSGSDGEVLLNGKPLKQGKIRIELREGKNPLVFSVKDRAGNRAVVKREVLFQRPPRVTLAEIGKAPEKYAGKLVLIEGYAWGWRATPPKEAGKLPSAPGNTARTRSWGSIEDGTALALFPIAPSKSGKVRAYVVIRIKGRNWLLEPIYTEFLR